MVGRRVGGRFFSYGSWIIFFLCIWVRSLRDFWGEFFVKLLGIVIGVKLDYFGSDYSR